MNYKFGFLAMVLGVITLGAVPFGLAQLDPDENAYMEIDMLAGQTENPFRIQDENNNDVFSIETDGHITDHMRFLMYSNEAGTTIQGVNWVEADITTPTHAGVLAYWDLQYTDVSSIDGFPIFSTHGSEIHVTARNTSGAVFCNLEFQYNTNALPSTWNTFDSGVVGVSDAIGVYKSNGNWDAEDGRGEINDIRIIVHVSGGTGECEYSQVMAGSLFHIPKWVTVERLK